MVPAGSMKPSVRLLAARNGESDLSAGGGLDARKSQPALLRLPRLSITAIRADCVEVKP